MEPEGGLQGEVQRASWCLGSWGGGRERCDFQGPLLTMGKSRLEQEEEELRFVYILCSRPVGGPVPGPASVGIEFSRGADVTPMPGLESPGEAGASGDRAELESSRSPMPIQVMPRAMGGGGGLVPLTHRAL